MPNPRCNRRSDGQAQHSSSFPHLSQTRDPLKTFPPLPLSSHAKPVDSFAAAAELEKELQKTVGGEVRFDRGSRALYAADGSNYRQIPIGLVIPRDDRRRDRDRSGMQKVRRSGFAARRGHEPGRAMLQCRGGARFHEVHEPDSGDRRRGKIRARPAGRGAGPAAGTRREAPSDVWPRPFDAQPMHAGRNDRQQFLRHAFVARRARPWTMSRSCAFCSTTERSMKVGATPARTN